ncbi:tetratricopeptide repeat-containing sensor histidine kinase [Arcicella rosea]|uniref:histidine kinase n=1 Tax=Arcicella rosea TaxID=502909 RepID=A0A841EH36_9BACT|nr:tetratricopeptide repeat-containing sensor histidine kinase [Arcicella rosea]MBB6002465.1 signal transduction histidine kinase [Arcicella rosea]
MLALVCSYSSVCYAQPNRLKILTENLANAKHDTDRVNTYYALSRFYWNKNADSALFMAEKSLILAKKNHFDKGMALAYLSKGVSLLSKGRLPEALECLFKSLRISEKLGLIGLSGNVFINIGNVYADMEDYNNALFYYRKAYNIALQHNYSTFNELVDIGEIFKYKNQPDSTIAYNQKALKIAQVAKDTMGIIVTYYNIGENNITLKNYSIARNYLSKALVLAEEMNDDEGITYCHNAFALVYYHTGKYQKSLEYALMALEENKKIGISEISKQVYHVLYLTHLKLGNYKEALQIRNLEVALKDSLSGVEKTMAITKIQSGYGLEKQQQQINLLKKSAIIKQEELKNTELKRNLITAVALFLLVLALLLVKNFVDKKKLIKQLEEQNRDISTKNLHLEELILVRNRIFSIIAHDLRGPVHSIAGMMDVLKTESMDEEEKGFFIENASQSLHVTANLLDNLLYWARSQMDGMQVNTIVFDIQQVIQQNIALIEARAIEKSIKVCKEEGKLPQMVSADQAMIDIVIRNLVENAVKFLKAGNTVRIATEEKENELTVSIKDDGQGISQEAQSKIFNKYTSYSSFGTAQEKGSGLGLLLCKELIEKNQGKIWFESKPNEGTTFYFTIPLN